MLQLSACNKSVPLFLLLMLTAYSAILVIFIEDVILACFSARSRIEFSSMTSNPLKPTSLLSTIVVDVIRSNAGSSQMWQAAQALKNDKKERIIIANRER